LMLAIRQAPHFPSRGSPHNADPPRDHKRASRNQHPTPPTAAIAPVALASFTPPPHSAEPKTKLRAAEGEKHHYASLRYGLSPVRKDLRNASGPAAPPSPLCTPHSLDCALQRSRHPLKVLAMKSKVSSAARSRSPIIPKWDDLQICIIT
jgi:hypothetical protein